MTNYTNLRVANNARQLEWDRGNQVDLDWRLNELAGEVGEVCNVLKKLHRERLRISGSRADRQMLADELADCAICLDLALMTANLPPVNMDLHARTRKTMTVTPLTVLGTELFRSTAFFIGCTVAGHVADTVYERLQVIADREGINLGIAIAAKFNETSEKMHLKTRLEAS